MNIDTIFDSTSDTIDNTTIENSTSDTEDNTLSDISDKTLISFDYAIKYLLKDKSGYEIVEGFISALLVSNGYSRVKIKSILESESNREERILKRSVADVIVEDEAGNKYLVEIDRSYTSMFLHKACFNTSRLIVDSISANDDYSTIKKVFHINLLYFPFNNMKSPLYHGKTIFHEIDKEHPQNIHLMDMTLNAFDSYNVFPEYFVISVPMFNDVIKDEMDEWLYMMKHSKIPENFKSPYMQKVAQRLSILTMTKDEREKYRADRSETLKGRDYLVSAEEKGIEIGEARGEAKLREEKLKAEERLREEKLKAEERLGEEKLKIAQEMLADGDAIEKVARITKLSLDQIKEIQVR